MNLAVEWGRDNKPDPLGVNLTKALSAARIYRYRQGMSIASVPGWGELRPGELRSWVLDTLHHARELAAGHSVHNCPFRVRLHGVLADIRNEIRKHPELGQLNGGLAVLRDVFTEDETWCLQYLRDMECHPLRHFYERPVTNRITGAKQDSEAFEQTVKRVMDQFVDDGELLRAVGDPSFLPEVGKRMFERATMAFALRAMPPLHVVALLPWPDRL